MIYVDVSAAVHARAGIGRYSANLAKALIRTFSRDIGLFFNGRNSNELPSEFNKVPQRHIPLGYKPWRSAVLAGQFTRIGFDRLLPDAQLYHATEHLLMPLRKTPTVLTVHDLIYKLYPQYHKKLNYAYLNRAMPIFCQRADAIIAVSEATRADIVNHYAIDPAKIHVVYEAASESFTPPDETSISAVRAKYGLPERYLIHIGTIEPRKNLIRLLDAFQIIRTDLPDLSLVLAGSKGWLYDDFFLKVRGENLTEQVRILGWVPDEALPAVIAGAACAVQPSIYEGFGLPILEHMACGQIVAASNSSSHPEVGGEAAEYFDPFDVADIADTIVRLVTSDSEREKRRELSLHQASKFSWQKSAEQTAKIYNSLLAG